MSTSSEAVVVAAFLRFLEGSCSLFLCLRFLSGSTVSVDILDLLDKVVELNEVLVSRFIRRKKKKRQKKRPMEKEAGCKAVSAAEIQLL